jgi:hypothetical protein
MVSSAVTLFRSASIGMSFSNIVMLHFGIDDEVTLTAIFEQAFFLVVDCFVPLMSTDVLHKRLPESSSASYEETLSVIWLKVSTSFLTLEIQETSLVKSSPEGMGDCPSSIVSCLTSSFLFVVVVPDTMLS